MRGAKLAALLLFATIALHGQSQDTEPKPSVRACATIAANDVQLTQLGKLCEFALSYHRSLPNFVCQQQTSSVAMWLGGPPKTVIEQEVTYVDGTTHYNDLKVNGKAPTTARPPAIFITQGEFGSELIDLFRVPGSIQFRHAGHGKIHGVAVQEFSFVMPKDRNHVWTVSDGERIVTAEFRGSIWVDSAGRPVREELEPVEMPKGFLLEVARKSTEYAEVNLGDAGVHVLPVHAESRGCFRTLALRRIGAQPQCVHNTTEFRGCRKFAAKARIVESPQ